MVALLFCADSIAAGGKGKIALALFKVSFKGLLDPDPALLGTIVVRVAHPLPSTCDIATICEIRSVYQSKYMQAVAKF